MDRESGIRAAQERQRERDEFIGVLDEMAGPYQARMSGREWATFRLMVMALAAEHDAVTQGDPEAAEAFLGQAEFIMETFGVTPQEKATASGLLDIVDGLGGLFARQRDEELKQAGKLVVEEKFQRRKPQESEDAQAK